MLAILTPGKIAPSCSRIEGLARTSDKVLVLADRYHEYSMSRLTTRLFYGKPGQRGLWHRCISQDARPYALATDGETVAVSTSEGIWFPFDRRSIQERHATSLAFMQGHLYGIVGASLCRLHGDTWEHMARGYRQVSAANDGLLLLAADGLAASVISPHGKERAVDLESACGQLMASNGGFVGIGGVIGSEVFSISGTGDVVGRARPRFAPSCVAGGEQPMLGCYQGHIYPLGTYK
ncbi:hypothetical protein COY28_05660 [Candidatus Woesearchaeota archaeon CG_4_10_14_0_2_um_filter_57_5]|nr:MAG: hypothetical protein COV94_05915 [Candidatus Woesearchaeota archaeon CG11_big_fil_rev_8_21_14_0_20_57_5]PIZ50180.1 MAG: hypothetical protein COY28_05660 [Candidatus Woesearchaeota archaeon CG_4_10_14_0_2_um_filter_57_5]